MPAALAEPRGADSHLVEECPELSRLKADIEQSDADDHPFGEFGGL